MTATATKERPINFTQAELPMVRAILEGRKTQFRRVVKPQPDGPCQTRFDESTCVFSHWDHEYPDDGARVRCPFGAPGDRLWVREAHILDTDGDGNIERVVYRADYDEQILAPGWQPSIHMKREHSRITLEVKRRWVERVQEISRDDAIAEGVYEHELSNYRENQISRRRMAAFNRGETDTPNDMEAAARFRFAELWDSIYGKSHPWFSDPWVWCVEFERVER